MSEIEAARRRERAVHQTRAARRPVSPDVPDLVVTCCLRWARRSAQWSSASPARAHDGEGGSPGPGRGPSPPLAAPLAPSRVDRWRPWRTRSCATPRRPLLRRPRSDSAGLQGVVNGMRAFSVIKMELVILSAPPSPGALGRGRHEAVGKHRLAVTPDRC